jgi:hypothetical protein
MRNSLGSYFIVLLAPTTRGWLDGAGSLISQKIVKAEENRIQTRLVSWAEVFEGIEEHLVDCAEGTKQRTWPWSGAY